MMYSDVIHGEIILPQDICEIITTPHFQRLKSITQLGPSLYSQLNHTRFDHSIGTYYMAQRMLYHLEKNSNFQKTDLYKFCKRCVEIAALLHDIGHGPFSHFWEHKIVSNFKHELNAFPIIDIIFSSSSSYGIRISTNEKEHQSGVDLIKDIISGKQERYLGNLDSLQFIFEIVNNEKCLIDVDKWDYLKRDTHYINLLHLNSLKHVHVNFDSVFERATVSLDGKHIEYNYEDRQKINNLFNIRETYHFMVYGSESQRKHDEILASAIKRAESLGFTFLGKTLPKITGKDPEFLYLTDQRLVNALYEINDFYITELLDTWLNNIKTKDKSQIKLPFSTDDNNDPYLDKRKIDISGLNIAYYYSNT